MDLIDLKELAMFRRNAMYASRMARAARCPVARAEWLGYRRESIGLFYVTLVALTAER